MATKPTRLQQQACDRFAEALALIAEGARIDGAGALDLAGIADRLAGASSAFGREEIIGRALERRGQALGLRAGTADLFLLMEGEGAVDPLRALLLGDDAFRELVGRLETELGEV
jgi:hypothetical protein